MSGMASGHASSDLLGAALGHRYHLPAAPKAPLVPSRTMSSRVAVVLGLLAGILTSVVLIAVVFLVGPDLAPPVGVAVAGSGSPTAAPGTAAPSTSSAPSAPASQASADPSGAEPTDALPSEAPPSVRVTLPPRSPIAGQFHVGEPAPKLVLPLLGGATVDLAEAEGQARLGELHGHVLPALPRRVPR